MFLFRPRGLSSKERSLLVGIEGVVAVGGSFYYGFCEPSALEGKGDTVPGPVW